MLRYFLSITSANDHQTDYQRQYICPTHITSPTKSYVSWKHQGFKQFCDLPSLTELLTEHVLNTLMIIHFKSYWIEIFHSMFSFLAIIIFSK